MRACPSELSLANGISTPIRRICPDCCARKASDQATAEPPTSVMKSRRLMGFRPHAEDHTLAYHWAREGVAHRRNISPPMSHMVTRVVFARRCRYPVYPLTADMW